MLCQNHREGTRERSAAGPFEWPGYDQGASVPAPERLDKEEQEGEDALQDHSEGDGE